MAATLKDKVPPHNLDAEQATLGALLLDWDAVDTVIAASLKVENFWSPRNQVIFKAILSLKEKGQHGDLLTLTEELRSSGKLEVSGGVAYVSALTDTVPTSANVEYYAQVVRDASIRRELILTAAQITAGAHDETQTSGQVLEDAQNKIFTLTNLHNTTEIRETKKVVMEASEVIETHYKNKDEYTGIPTGFTKLDEMTSGFQNEDFIVIGARPSMGKTALALSMAQHMAIVKNIPVGFFSLEMNALSIMMRLISMVSKVPSGKLRSGFLSTNDLLAIGNAESQIYDAPLYLVDSSNLRLLDLRALARRMVTQKQVKIIFIDYIGLITVEDGSKPRFEQVAEISRSLKSLARELKIPLVVLSQVGRDAEGQNPTLAKIRDSGAIEQDADVVIFIGEPNEESSSKRSGHTFKEEDEDAKNKNERERKLLLSKQRNGPTGKIDVVYHSQYTKFENKPS
jgi:replicative DNA helicase